MTHCKSLFRALILTSFLLAVGAFAAAQQNPLEPGGQDVTQPVVTFELNWPAADPQWFRISVEPGGRSSYQSKPQTKENETPGDPYILKFITSQPTRTKIFDLAKALNYFQGNFESKYKVARTGDKTLTYLDGSKQMHTTVNYSDNPQMRELVDIFQKMSTTFEMSRKLDYDIRFDKLGLERDLKAMEELNKNNSLMELQVISPTLERIANDTGIMNISRARARRLLDRAQIASGSR